MGKEDEENAVEEPEIQDAGEVDKLLIEQGYKADDLDGMTDPEKAAILGKDEEPEDDGAPEEEGGDDAIDKDTLEKIAADGDKPPEPPPADVPPVVPEKPPEKPPEAPPEPAKLATDEELLAFRPVVTDADIKVELPSLDAISDETQAKLDELDEQFDAGDVPAREYNRQRDKIIRQVFSENLQAREKAKAAAIPDVVWEKEQTRFLQSRPDYVATDVRGKALWGALDGIVQMLSNDPAKAGWTGMQLLIEADRQVREMFGIGKPAKVELPVAPAVPVKDSGKPPTPIPDVKTLAGIPAAGKEDTGDDPYAQIDKLRGDDLEDALARLSPVQREDYLGRTSKPSRRR